MLCFVCRAVKSDDERPHRSQGVCLFRARPVTLRPKNVVTVKPLPAHASLRLLQSSAHRRDGLASGSQTGSRRQVQLVRVRAAALLFALRLLLLFRGLCLFFRCSYRHFTTQQTKYPPSLWRIFCDIKFSALRWVHTHYKVKNYPCLRGY